MKVVQNFNYEITGSTSSANYYSKTTSLDSLPGSSRIIRRIETGETMNESGKYSVFSIANWFLSKGNMTHKKLQKLCYYAQAWCYTLKGYRLADTDFQAWVHGPVSPVLYETFKKFGYTTIAMKGNYVSDIEKTDEELLEDVWETYGDRDGNALEALSHREAPWNEARRGYAPNEKCTVVIDPDEMKKYYRSISIEE